MKKRLSMTAVNSRTCPLCFSMVDPVWYGWHITRCPSSDKLTSTQKPLSADIAPLTPVKNEMAEDSQFAEANNLHVTSAGEVASVSFPTVHSFTPALDSQTQKEKEGQTEDSLPPIANGIPCNSRTQNPDTIIQELETSMSSLRRENEALSQKVKDLESKQEDLQCQLTVSKEAKRNALCLVESLRAELREKDELCSSIKSNLEGLLSQLTQSRDVKVKTLGQVESLCAVLGQKDKFYCCKPVEVEDCSDRSEEERGIATDLEENFDVKKKLDLDHIVGVACGEASPSHDFLSQVDGSIKEALTFTLNTFGKQGDLPGTLSNANNTDGSEEASERCEDPDSVDHGGEIPANLQDGSSPVNAPHNGVETSQIDVDREVPSKLASQRVVLDTQLVEKTNSTDGAKISQADRLACANVVEDGVSNTNSLLLEERKAGPSPEMKSYEEDTCLNTKKQHSIPLPQAFPENQPDSPLLSPSASSDSYAKQFPEKQSHSLLLSFSAGSDLYTIKTKSGIRRIVLMSDSRSESGPMQNNHSGSNTAKSHHCSRKVNGSPDVSCEAGGGQSNRSSAGTCAAERRNAYMAAGIEEKTLRRSKRLKVLSTRTLKSASPNQSTDVSCEVQSEQSSHRSATEAGIGAEGHTGREPSGVQSEPTAVRRSKRLKTLSFWKSRNNAQSILSPDEESRPTKKISSSHGKKFKNVEESEMCRSEASTSSHSSSLRMQFQRKGSSRIRKRLFQEAESRVLSPNKQTTDSEEDDSESESDEGESLGGFITDSEGREGSQTSDQENSSSRAFSSEDNPQLELYDNWRIMKHLKLKNYVWDNEVEMVSVLETNLELCLRAVCALNRRQTEDEQIEKASKYVNKRGFDSLHAARGSRIAEFLTDGDPSGPMKKSIEDLRKHDANALRFCKMLAFKHSKQLFEMYKNEEDPHFPCQ